MIPEIFLLLQPPPTQLCLKLEFLLKMSFLLSLSLILRRRTVPMVFLLWFSKLVLPSLPRASVNYFVFVSLLQPSPSCWKRELIQPVPKKGDPSQPSNYRLISLTSVLSKVFKSILNRKIWKHLNTSNLISDRHYGFSKKRSTGDLLSPLSDSWSSALRGFGESFAVALDISKAFDRAWHKALIFKLPSFGIYPSLCDLLSDFLSGRSIAAVVDSHRSSYKSINSGVPQGSVLSPTLSLLFINDLLSVTSSPIHSYDDDSTLHYSFQFEKRPTQQQLIDSRRVALEQLTSDLSLISNWGRENMVVFNASKTQFLNLSTRHNLPHNYDIFFENISTNLHL